MDKGMGALRQSRVWLDDYLPERVDAAAWSAVRPFVVGCADRLGVGDDASARRVVRVLARLVVWSLGQGLPLDVEVVLDPDTVERFVMSGLADDRSRATYRSVLRRVGPLLTRRAPWEPVTPAVARRQVAAPYTPAEIAALRAGSLVQATPARVRAARALLALGAGAGLDGRWVSRVSADDVIVAGSVLVRVGEPAARVVPVLAVWEDEVAGLAASAGGEFLVGGRSTARNRAGQLAASIVVGHGQPRLSASRLRSTWLVTHLAMGTRLAELMAAAGLQGITVLSDLLAFVPAVDGDTAAEMLRREK